MCIKTRSGSIYLFNTKEGKLYMMKGLHEYIVDELNIGIGLPLKIRCRMLNTFSCEPGEEMVITSSPVVDIR